MIVSLILIIYGCNRWNPERRFGRNHPPFPDEFAKQPIHRIERMAEDLNLTDEQEDSLVKIQREIIEKHAEIRGRERQDRMNIKKRIAEMIRQDTLSEKEILDFMNEMHAVREKFSSELDTFTANRLARAHSVLTGEQRKRMIDRLERFDRRRKER